MRRREFIRNGALATGGFLSKVGASGSQIDQVLNRARAASFSPAIPDLDELAGDWMPEGMIAHTPALANFHGSCETSRNILGIRNFTLAPYSQGGEMAILELNGAKVNAKDFRWYAYQVQRRETLDNVSLVTTLRMPFEQPGVMLAVDIINTSSKDCTITLKIHLGAAIRQYPGKWEWDTPRPRAQDQGDFESGLIHLDDGHLFYVRDTKSQSTTGFLFLLNPHQFSPPSLSATWTLGLKPGETFSLNGLMTVGPEINSVKHMAAEWKSNFTALWDEARTRWEERYLAAFDPENGHFSGNLPTLATPDSKIRRLYYSSIVGLLCLERTNLNVTYPRVFVTASPRWATTLVYFWDTSFFATVWALLDPVAMKQHLTMFLASNIHSCYAVDFHSMETVGPWYSANDYSLFQLVTTYVNVSGDERFLDEAVQRGKRVIDYLEEMSLYWQRLPKPSGLLADYGDASNLLETVPTYIHFVPSMNAANVWMMRSVANIRKARGESDRVADLNRLADRLAKEVLNLYIDGQGFWACRMTDGSKVEVRHCIDFITMIATIEEDLGGRRIEEMTAFVNRELWTPQWLYALSPCDGAAKVATRPDHGSTGSYDAWPAVTAEAIFKTGLRAEALDRLRSNESATREGPFGQAHYAATEEYPVRKAMDLQDYFESASGSFAEVIIRSVFGFSHATETEWPPAAATVPGFEGSLTNLRFRGKLLTITVPHLQ